MARRQQRSLGSCWAAVEAGEWALQGTDFTATQQTWTTVLARTHR